MPNNKQAKQDREELSALEVADLKARLEEEKRKLWKMRFDLGKRQLTNTADISKTRKRIARIHTYLGQREQGGVTVGTEQ